MVNTTVDENSVKIRRPVASGVNTKGNPAIIGLTQIVRGTNSDLTDIGRHQKRDGYSQVADDIGNNEFTALARYFPQGGTDYLLGLEGTNLRYWTGGASWSSPVDTGFTDTDYAKITVAKNKAYIFNGTDNVHSVDSSLTVTDLGDTSADPPKGTVSVWFRDRLWVALDEIIYYSDVGDPETFDRTANFFRVNEGDNQEITNIVPFRNDELLIFKTDSIWLLTVGGTNASNWYLQPVDVNTGCVSREAAVRVGDDIFYYANDGIRSLARNQNDKVVGVTVAVSYPIDSVYIENINFNKKDLIRATVYDNKVIFGVPGQNEDNINQWFVYFLHQDPQANGWAIWETIPTINFVQYPVSGKQNLYFSTPSDGVIFKMFDGSYLDNGSGYTFEVQGRFEDIGEENLQANRKKALSLFIRTETASNNSMLEVSMRFDQNDWNVLGTVDMNENLPTLPLTLPFSLGGKNVVINKFNGLDNFNDWYNCQVRLRMFDNDNNGTNLVFLEYMIYVCNVNDYEHQI